MDLYSADSKRIQTLITEWLAHPEQELEATFGAGGVVDATTFLNITQRLRAKGYEALPQDDRLSIITPNNIRLSLQGLGVLQNYCRDDILEGKPYSAMIKDRTSSDSNLDLGEYDMRIKSRREINLAPEDPRVREIIQNWNNAKKAFRLLRRWTFKGNGMRIDMSIVRSSPKDNRGEFRWARKFTEVNLFKQPPVYEVEVELLREDATSTAAGATKCFIRGIGEILRAIQKNTLLIRKSIRAKVITQYTAMNGSDRFRGVAPITLERANMVDEIDSGVPNIRKGYNVTDKADGLRCLGFCNDKGEFFMIDMGMNVYRTGLRNKKCANSLLDGEWVTKDKDKMAINHYLLFDIYRAPGGEDVSQLPFAIPGKEEEKSRWMALRSWISAWSAEDNLEVVAKELTEAVKLQIAMKTFLFADGTDPLAIFVASARILDTRRIYSTDGVILTPNDMALPSKSGETFYEQFKWKPSSDNTIDFLVNFEKDVSMPTLDKVVTGIQPISGESLRYKTLRLYVGSIKDSAYDDPRSTILNMLPLPDQRNRGKPPVYKPSLFNPADHADTMANTSYCKVTLDVDSGQELIITEHTHEPIQDRSIIEMRYDPLQEPGWRWIPIRIRHDKTERLMRGQIARTLNSEKVANSVWNSIHDPITESMIRTGSEDPTEEEMKLFRRAEEGDISRVYYERKAQAEDLGIVRGMRDFHNRYIKGDILYTTALKTSGKSIIDYACGRAGDLNKWRFGKASFVLGVDVAGDNILDAAGGAYRRYLNTIITVGKERVPSMIFAIGNSSKSLVNGKAGATPEESNILRSIFGRSESDEPVPKLIEAVSAGTLRAGADVGACMFALHYFFESTDSLNGFIQNLADTIKTGGYFIGCCFDGQRVFNMLREIDTGKSKIGKEGDVPIWSIRKSYDNEELTDDDTSVGMAVDVEFISIGTTHREYLVPFDYLKKRMSAIGFELLTADESKSAGLHSSTNLFSESYAMAEKAGHKYIMTETVKEFSFLNRWFIFKRRAMTEIAAEELEKEDNTTQSIVERDGTDADIMENITNTVTDADADADAGAGKEIPATTSRLPSADAVFKPVEILHIGPAVALKRMLQITNRGSEGAGRWLALNAPFPINDTEGGVIYPSVEHYMAGMKVKHAGRNPVLANTLFSSDGKIHQGFEDKRKLTLSVGTSKDPIDYEKFTAYYDLLTEESNAIKAALTPKTLQSIYKVKIDDALWTTMQETLLRDALAQRWSRDTRFIKYVTAAREAGKYLLYYLGPSGAGGWSGGVRKMTGKIDGENKVGRIIMELAGFKF